MSVYEAVSLYTRGGAYMSFDEKEKGQIAAGYLADMAVLSRIFLRLTLKKLQIFLWS